MKFLLQLIGGFFATIFIIAIILFLIAFIKGSWKNRNTSFARLFKRNMRDKKLREPIKVFYFDFEENFNRFPFRSEFHQTDKFLLNKNENKEVNASILKEIYNNFEDLFLDWSTQESRLLSKFDEVQMSSPVRLKFAIYIKYYNDYLDKTRQVFMDEFVNRIMPACIGQGLDYKCKDIFLTGEFKDIIRDAKKKINQYNAQRCNEVINNATRDISQMIENLFGGFQRAFNQQARGNYQRQNNQQSNWQKPFSEPSELSKAYKTMGVSENINDRDLKKTYLKLAKQYHPDVNDSVYAKEKMAKINSAYDTIRKSRGI